MIGGWVNKMLCMFFFIDVFVRFREKDIECLVYKIMVNVCLVNEWVIFIFKKENNCCLWC